MSLSKEFAVVSILKHFNLIWNRNKLISFVSVIALLVAIAPLSGCTEAGNAEKTEELEKSEKTVTSEKSEKDVSEATNTWLNTVTSGSEGVVDETVALYAEDGVLWGTVSEQVRDTPAEISDYFEYFAKLPELSVSSYKGCIRMYDENFAINSGYYTFTFSKDGETKEVPARYSFAYQKNDGNQWEIVEHHSSALPEAPEALEIVNTEQDACENGLLVEK